MNKLKLISYFVFALYIIGCSSYQNESLIYKPEYRGLYVYSEKMLNAYYQIPEEYCVIYSDTNKRNIWDNGSYNCKDISILQGIKLDSNQVQVIPVSKDTVTIKRRYYFEGMNRIDTHDTKGMKVYIINFSKDTLKTESIQDGSLIIIQQAKNSDGKWKPIEFWAWSTCSESQSGVLVLPPNKYISVNAFRYKGEYQTELRFVMLYCVYNGKWKKIYSRNFKGSINLSQFEYTGPKEFSKDLIDN